MFSLVSTSTLGLFCQDVFQTGGSQHVLVHGVPPPLMQYLATPFAELHEVFVSLIQPEVLLDVSTICWIFSHFTLFWINSKASTCSLWRTSGWRFQRELSHKYKYLEWAVILNLIVVTSVECVESQMANYLVLSIPYGSCHFFYKSVLSRSLR